MPLVRLMILGVLLLLAPLTSLAQVLKNHLGFRYGYYGDNVGVTVHSPGVTLARTIGHHWLLNLKGRIDAITAASIRNGSGTQNDAVTGASSRPLLGIEIDDVRYAPQISLTYSKGDHTGTFGGYLSSEGDYQGRSLFGTYTLDLNEQNSALTVSVSQADDRWEPRIDRSLSQESRTERQFDLSFSQLITPKSQLQLAYSYIQSDGFLSHPYQYLLTDETARFEAYPDTRSADAFSGTLVSFIGNANALHLHYRYYQDDWAVKAHTFNLEGYRELSGRLTLGLRGRYYTQSGADFYLDPEAYTLQSRYVGIDYRNSAFDSTTFGAMGSVGLGDVALGGQTLTEGRLEMSLDRYETTDNDYIRHWYGEPRITAWFATLSIGFAY